MPRLSIVIPLLSMRSAKAFEGTLASILSSLPDSTEVLVLDAVRYGDPWDVGKEGVRFFPLSLASIHGQGRSTRSFSETVAINETVARANGDIVHLLMPGTTVHDGWTRDALGHFENEQVACVVPGLYDAACGKTFSHGMLYQTNGELRAFRGLQSPDNRCVGVVPHFGAVFFRKKHWDRCGGLDPSLIPGIAYAHMVLLLQACHRETIVEPESRIGFQQAPDPVSTPGKFLWGAQTEKLYNRWLAGSNRSLLSEHVRFMHREFWMAFPTANAFLTLLGRFSAWFAASEKREIQRICRILRDELDDRSTLPEPRYGESRYPERHVA